jgi:hypothetical protein
MATNSEKGKQGWRNDEDTTAVVYQGASLSQLAGIFEMNDRDIKAKITGVVTPCGERRGHPIYKIREVAPYLVPPPYDIDEFIQRMSIADLPTILRKEYWAGMRSRQLYEKEAAELWPTDKVVETVSTLLKTIRMSMLLAREAVERETDLTPRQRDIVTRLIDNALEDAHASTVKQFTKAKPDDKSADIYGEEQTGSEDL